MEPTKITVEIGQFKITEVRLNAIRVALGQGVNIWIHTNFEHKATADDHITLLAEIPNAHTRSTPV